MISSFGSVPQFVKEQSLTIANVAAASAPYQSFTVTGLTPDMTVLVNPTSDLPENVGLGAAYISATNTLKVQFINPTNAQIAGAAVVFKIMAF
jgi:hypothetical protein